MESVKMSVSKDNRNLYETYTFDVTPTTSSFASGDYLSLLFESTMVASPAPVCTKTSSNINSLSCVRVNNTFLRVPLTVNSLLYASDKTLSFNVQYVKNPDFEGLVRGFAVLLTDSSNQMFENYTSLSHTFTSYVLPTSRSLSFTDNRVGVFNTSKLSIQVPSLLLAGSKIEISLGTNFVLTNNATLSSASIASSVSLVNTTGRKIVINILENIVSDRTIDISIDMLNPSSPTMQTTDYSLKVITPDNRQVFSINALANPLIFVCGTNCTECSLIYTNCSKCIENNQLTSQNTCEYTPPSKFVFPPFIFLSIALLLALLVFVIGKICGFRNYSANLLYSMLKVNFFGFLILFGIVLLGISKDISINVKYALYALAVFHIIITWIFFCLFRASIAHPALSLTHVPINGHYIKITKEDEEHGSEEALEHNYTKTINILSALAFLFSTSIFRWLYSEASKRKAYLWHFTPVKYSQIRHYLECYSLFYICFFTLPFISALVYLLYPSKSSDWNLYMVEGVCLCIFDLFMYVFAFVELSNSKAPAKKYSDATINNPNESILDHKSGLLDNTMKEENIKKDIEASDQQLSKSKLLVSQIPNLLIERKFSKSTSKIDEDRKLDQIKLANTEYMPSSSRMLNTESPRFEKITLMPLFIGGSKLISRDSKRDSIDSNLDDNKKKNKIVPRTRPSQESFLKPIQIPNKNTKDLHIKLPSRQLTISDDGESGHDPIKMIKAQESVKKQPKVKLVTTKEGVTKPQLVEIPEIKEDFLPLGDELKDQKPKDLSKVKPYLDDDGDEITKYQSERFDLDNSSLKKPEKSRFKENQLFSKWWFNSSKKYLEIIYEEEEDHVNFNENPDYDDKPKIEEIIVAKVPEKKKIPNSLDKIINGQLESDLNKGIVRDRNNVPILMTDQKPENFEKGELLVKPDTKILMNTQPVHLFEKGYIKDVDGRLYRTKDQDFKKLSDGVMLTRDGKVDNINGQKPEDVMGRILKDREGNIINLNKQPKDCYEKNSFIVDRPNKDIDTIEFERPQLKSNFEKGIVTAPNGQDVRLKDQNVEEIKNQGMYRDRNLKLLPIEPLGEHRLMVQPKPKNKIIIPLSKILPSSMTISQEIETGKVKKTVNKPSIIIVNNPKKVHPATEIPPLIMPLLKPLDIALNRSIEKDYTYNMRQSPTILPHIDTQRRIDTSYITSPRKEKPEIIIEPPRKIDAYTYEENYDSTVYIPAKFMPQLTVPLNTSCDFHYHYLDRVYSFPSLQGDVSEKKTEGFKYHKPANPKYIPVESSFIQKKEESLKYYLPSPAISNSPPTSMIIEQFIHAFYLKKSQPKVIFVEKNEGIPILRTKNEENPVEYFNNSENNSYSDGLRASDEDIDKKEEKETKQPIGVIFTPPKTKAVIKLPRKEPKILPIASKQAPKNPTEISEKKMESPSKKSIKPPNVEVYRVKNPDAFIENPLLINNDKNSRIKDQPSNSKKDNETESKKDLFDRYNKKDGVEISEDKMFDDDTMKESDKKSIDLFQTSNRLDDHTSEKLDTVSNASKEVPIREILKMDRGDPKNPNPQTKVNRGNPPPHYSEPSIMDLPSKNKGSRNPEDSLKHPSNRNKPNQKYSKDPTEYMQEEPDHQSPFIQPSDPSLKKSYMKNEPGKHPSFSYSPLDRTPINESQSRNKSPSKDKSSIQSNPKYIDLPKTQNQSKHNLNPTNKNPSESKEDKSRDNPEITFADQEYSGVNLNDVPIVKSRPSKPVTPRVHSPSMNKNKELISEEEPKSFKKFEFPPSTNPNTHNDKFSDEPSERDQPSRDRKKPPLVVTNNKPLRKPTDSFQSVFNEPNFKDNSVLSNSPTKPNKELPMINNKLPQHKDIGPSPKMRQPQDRLPNINNQGSQGANERVNQLDVDSIEDMVKNDLNYVPKPTQKTSSPKGGNNRNSKEDFSTTPGKNNDSFKKSKGDRPEETVNMKDVSQDISSIHMPEEIDNEKPVGEFPQRPIIGKDNFFRKDPHDKPDRPEGRGDVHDSKLKLPISSKKHIDESPNVQNRKNHDRPILYPSLPVIESQSVPKKPSDSSRLSQSKPLRLPSVDARPKTKTANISRPSSKDKTSGRPNYQRKASQVDQKPNNNTFSKDSMIPPQSSKVKNPVKQNNNNLESANSFGSNKEDSNMMYLNLVMDESVDLELNIEEMDDDENAERNEDSMQHMIDGNKYL